MAKPETGGLADLELKLGIDLFAGKSEITEGCSDFREIGDSSDLPGISDLRLSKSYGSDAADDANFGAAVAGPSPVPVLLLEQSPWVLGSTEQIKADGGDGPGDLRAESFEAQCFRGIAAETWRVAAHGQWAAAAEAGDWGAERAHLARAAKGA